MADLDGNDSFWDEVGGQRYDPPPPSRPAHATLAMYRRDPREISQDPHGWANRIRAGMGWPPPAARAEGTWETTRALAARQVAEARAAREASPLP